MLLMNAAYAVHGTIAPILPFEISRDQKLFIKDTILWVEGSVYNEPRHRAKDEKQE